MTSTKLDLVKCKTCYGFYWNDKPHTCLPLWYVAFQQDYEDEAPQWRDVYAATAEEAAEKFVESRHPNGDFYESGECVCVYVKGAQTARYIVRVESAMEFHASYAPKKEE